MSLRVGALKRRHACSAAAPPGTGHHCVPKPSDRIRGLYAGNCRFPILSSNPISRRRATDPLRNGPGVDTGSYSDVPTVLGL